MQYTQKQNYIKLGKEPLPDSYTGTTCVVFFPSSFNDLLYIIEK